MCYNRLHGCLHEERSLRRKKSTRKKPKRKSPQAKNRQATGQIFVHHRGFGFVRLEKSFAQKQDVFIPKQFLSTAIDQDIVELEITNSSSPKGPEGKVLRVIERKKTLFPALVMGINASHYELHLPSLNQDHFILMSKTGKTPAKPFAIGDRILVAIQRKKNTWEATYSRTIGSIQEPLSDPLFACYEQGISHTFPKNCLEEAENWGSSIKKQEREKRVDLTQLRAMTIDPETAKDFDDALSIHVDEQKHFHLGVHIADAAYYVQMGTVLDQEAEKRANSTYFPGKCVPMLPENLSNGLCSLKPNVYRLAVSVLMRFDAEGLLQEKTIVRSVIRSKKRWSYPDALACLQGKKKSPFKQDLELLVTLAKLLKKQRRERGSIDFSLNDTKILVDPKGEPIKLVQEEYDITHQLVEEFMLKANEIVATTLSEKQAPTIYRIHEEPQKESFHEFVVSAKNLGFSLPDHPDEQALQELFYEAKSSPHFSRLCFYFIRSMKLASYSQNNVGHYGLKLKEYVHFTSPIRRYADLLTQRMLFEEALPPSLDRIAQHLSDQERRSMKAENSVIQIKKLRLLEKQKKRAPNATYTASITSVKPYVIFFELQEYLLEGSLHISQIGYDYFIFDPTKNELVGANTGLLYKIGEEIQVRVSHINLLLQQVKYAIAPS